MTIPIYSYVIEPIQACNSFAKVSRHHLFLYILLRKWEKGAVMKCRHVHIQEYTVHKAKTLVYTILTRLKVNIWYDHLHSLTWSGPS